MSEEPYDLGRHPRLQQDLRGTPRDRARPQDWTREESYMTLTPRDGTGHRARSMMGRTAKLLVASFAAAALAVPAAIWGARVAPEDVLDRAHDAAEQAAALFTLPRPSSGP